MRNAAKLAESIQKQMIRHLANRDFARANIDRFGGAGIPGDVRAELVNLLTESQQIAVGLREVQPAIDSVPAVATMTDFVEAHDTKLASVEYQLKQAARYREIKRYNELTAA